VNDPELIMSPLCRSITHDGHTVDVEIYRIQTSNWTLEVVDALGNSTVWTGQFESDQGALDELNRTISEEGIGGMVGPIENVEV
jgi:hypothetical protein